MGFETLESACAQSREGVPKRRSRADRPMFWLDAGLVPMTLPPASSRSTLMTHIIGPADVRTSSPNATSPSIMAIAAGDISSAA